MVREGRLAHVESCCLLVSRFLLLCRSQEQLAAANARMHELERLLAASKAAMDTTQVSFCDCSQCDIVMYRICETPCSAVASSCNMEAC